MESAGHYYFDGFCEILERNGKSKFVIKVGGLDILSEEFGSPSQIFGITLKVKKYMMD